MADDLSVTFGASIDRLVAGTEGARRAIESVKESTDKVTEGFKKLAEIAGISLGIEGFKSFIESMGELGLQTERTMALLGTTAQATLQLEGIAKLTGGSLEGMTTSIERLSLNVQKSTRDAFNPASLGLKVLGLSAKDLIGVPADQYFEKLAGAIGKFNPSLNLTNALMATGGRGVAQMLPMLLLGSEGYKKFKEEVDHARDGIAAAIPGMAETHEKLTLLGMTTQSLGVRIFTELKPAIDAIISQLGSFTAEVRDSIKEGGAWSYALDAVSKSARGIATAFASVGAMIRFLAAEAQAFWDTEKGNESKVGDELSRRLKEITENYKKTITELWGESDRAHITVSPRIDAGAMDEMAHERLQVAMRVLESEIALEQSALERKKAIFAFEVETKRMTENEKFAATEKAVQQQTAAELALYQRELQLDGLKLAQKQEIENKIVALKAKSNIDLIKLDTESVKAMTAKWQSAFTEIQSAWDSNLKGLLQRTTTFKQAFQNTFLDLTTKLISYFEKMGLEWLATQLGMTTAATTGAAARAAQEVVAMESTLPARIGKFTSDITALSAQTFAGIFANLAPLLGPAAAGPAEVGQATVLAQLAAVPKFAAGTASVPRDMLAMVHQGEHIAPAGAPADAARSFFDGRGGGGGHVFNLTLNPPANWTRAQKQREAEEMAGLVAQVFSRNPSLRPAY